MAGATNPLPVPSAPLNDRRLRNQYPSLRPAPVAAAQRSVAVGLRGALKFQLAVTLQVRSPRW